MVKLDEKIKTKVLRYDKEKQRISLGLKQLKEQHWDEIEEKYPVGGKIKGKVVSLVKYGAFIEIEEGIEGLVHISEMSWTQHIKHPSQMVSVGDEIDIVVLNVDRESRKISLGMKQCEEDPWERLEQVFKRGTRHKGIVRDLVPFGAFVELEPNIDGLIHISDLSWVRKVRHPGEIVKKGEEIEVTILNFDRNERRIALGLKQLEPDPWDRFEKEYPIRARSEGSGVRVLEKGVVVMLPLGVEGFIPNSQLGRSLAGENKKQIKEGDNLELEVIEFDKVNHRIVLSHAIIERGREKAVYRAYKDTSAEVKTTIGDIMRDSSVVTDIKKPISPKEEPEKVVEVQSELEVTKPVIEDVDVIVDETVIKAASEEEVAVEVTPEVPVEAEVVDAEIITEPVKDETGEEKEAVVARGKAKATIEEAEAKVDEKKAEVPTEEAKAEVVEEKVEAKVDDEKAKAKVTKDKAEEDTVPDTVKVEAPVDEEKKTDKVEIKPKKKPETKAKVIKTKTKKKTTSTSVKPKAKAKKKTEAATEEDKEKVKTVKSKPKTVKKKVEKDEKAEAKPKTKAKVTKTKDEGEKTKEP